MAAYDPFARGAFPVGVRTSCPTRDGRPLPTEIWYPATDAYAGQDLADPTPVRDKRLVVLRSSDHMHFCDRVEEVHELFRSMPQDPLFQNIQEKVPPITELCPGTHAYLTVRGLGLAHMDAHLKGDERAARFLSGDLRGTLAAQGVSIDVS